MSESYAIDLAARAIGSALLHSLWHGALIASLTVVALRTLRGASASARYVVACLGLLALVTTWMATVAYVGRSLDPTEGVRTTSGFIEPTVIELGPTGPRDLTPAVRPLVTSDALSDGGLPIGEGRLERMAVALVPLWLAGVLLLSARLALGWLLVERLRRTAIIPVSASLRDRVVVLARRLRIRRVVNVAQSAVVQVPVVIGWLRPVVLLPVSALTGLTPEQLESVVAHELAHVRRHDYAVNVLQSTAEVLLFYHPACWWLSRRIRVEREHCCDDMAVELCGDRVTYATALADLESLRSESSLALAAADGSLLTRIRRIVSPAPATRASAGWVAATVVPLVLILSVVAGSKRVSWVGEVLAQTSVPTAGRTIPSNEGVVEGRVIEMNSTRPVRDARVELLREGGGMASARTDHEGRYEAAALKPGSYHLTVHASGYVEGHFGGIETSALGLGAAVDVRAGRIVSGIDIRLQSAGSVSGRIWDVRGDALAGVEVELVAERVLADGARPVPVGFAQTGIDGSYRIDDVKPGDYVVRAYAAREVPSSAPAAPIAYAPTFYPGVPSVGMAQRLHVYAGQELLDVDFALGTTPLFRLAGKVLDPSEPVRPGVRVVAGGMGQIASPRDALSAPVDAKGHFEISRVFPGNYMLMVQDNRLTSRWVSTMRIVTVDADLTDIELRASLGATVEGSVVRDDGALGTFDASLVTVGFQKRLDGGGFTAGHRRVAADGTFSMESPGGSVTFQVETPKGWIVKSIRVDGNEIGDTPVDLGSGRRSVNVVLTDRASTVSGVVADRRGRILPDFSVVVFPVESGEWHPASRHIFTARSNNAGQFQMEAVPAGEYLVVAIPALRTNAWQSPDVLTQLQPLAERVRVAEGAPLMISIRAAPTPDSLKEAGWSGPR